ncbi:hypothetical protein PC110_g8853 [Phytophthora cactorum]|nr:hypothetical protein PC110_g8853 [Phytophthora cactorum]
MEGAPRLVEATIRAKLLDEFGHVLDGWTHALEHYVAVFAWYELDGMTKTALVSMAPIVNDPGDDLSARTHRDFLTGMLERDIQRQLSCCKYLDGDNCPVNRRIATMMQDPLVGCASHRLTEPCSTSSRSTKKIWQLFKR